MEPVLHRADDGFAVGSHGRVVIVVWRGVPTRERLVVSVEHTRAMSVSLGAPLGVLAVIEDGSPPPAPDDLAFVYRNVLADPPLVDSMAGVVETIGAAADAVLQAAEELGAAVGAQVALKTCFDLDEACAWLLRRMQPSGGAGARRDLARAVETLRAAMDPQRP